MRSNSSRKTDSDEVTLSIPACVENAVDRVRGRAACSKIRVAIASLHVRGSFGAYGAGAPGTAPYAPHGSAAQPLASSSGPAAGDPA